MVAAKAFLVKQKCTRMEARFPSGVRNPGACTLQDRAFDFVGGVARTPDVGPDLRDPGTNGLRSDVLDRMAIARTGQEVFGLDVNGVGT